MSARLRLAPPAPRRAPAGGPRSTKKPIPLFARRAPSGHRAPQKAPSVPTAAPRRAAGWGGAKGEAVEGVSGDAERGGRRAARTKSLALRSARAAISRSTSATRPFSAAVWSSVPGIAPRYAASRPLRADRSAPPRRLLAPARERRAPRPSSPARLRPPLDADRRLSFRAAAGVHFSRWYNKLFRFPAGTRGAFGTWATRCKWSHLRHFRASSASRLATAD